VEASGREATAKQRNLFYRYFRCHLITYLALGLVEARGLHKNVGSDIKVKVIGYLRA
jgi:hypothetical protein